MCFIRRVCRCPASHPPVCCSSPGRPGAQPLQRNPSLLPAAAANCNYYDDALSDLQARELRGRGRGGGEESREIKLVRGGGGNHYPLRTKLAPGAAVSAAPLGGRGAREENSPDRPLAFPRGATMFAFADFASGGGGERERKRGREKSEG